MNVADLGDAALGGQVEPLSAAALDQEREAFQHRLAPLRERIGIKILPYNPDKQWN